MNDPKSDARLLEEVRRPADRNEAFRAIVARHAPALLGFLRAYFRDAATAEDLLQQVFLTLIESPPPIPADGTLRPWLLQAARNRALHEKRRLRSHPTVAEPPEIEVKEEAPAEDVDPRRLEEALLRLPENYREILVLHRFQGMKYAEIAGIVGTTPGSARVLMHKALGLLRRYLSESR